MLFDRNDEISCFFGPHEISYEIRIRDFVLFCRCEMSL
jgi:hypothetical protein